MATAPVRIADCGGWTDTWFADRGAVCNVAAGPGVHVEATYEPSEPFTVSLDLPSAGGCYSYDVHAPARNRLVEKAIAVHGPLSGALTIAIRSAVPPGCGTGTSACVAVALIGALRALCGEPVVPAAVAQMAHELETMHLGQQSGVQDQWAAALGGAHLLKIDDYPVVTPIAINVSDHTWAALEQRLITVWLGRPHDSSTIHSQVIAELESGDVTRRLEPLRRAAFDAAHALADDDLVGYGAALTANNEAQRSLSPALIGADAQRAIDTVRSYGALGWKVNGSGGNGGTLTVLCTSNSTDVAAALADAGYETLAPVPTRHGLTVQSVATQGVPHG